MCQAVLALGDAVGNQGELDSALTESKDGACTAPLPPPRKSDPELSVNFTRPCL